MKILAGVLAVIILSSVVGALPLYAQTVSSQSESSSESSDSSDADMADLLIALGGQPADIDKRLVEAAQYPLGSDKNPIRVDGPEGEDQYLTRLRCQNGKAPKYNRRGNTGVGVFGHVIDLYDVKCPKSEPETSAIYMDMYFSDYREETAPQGFSIRR